MREDDFGLSCPLCRKSARELIRDEALIAQLGAEVAKSVEVAFHEWLPSDGICPQCIDDIQTHRAVWVPQRIG